MELIRAARGMPQRYGDGDEKGAAWRALLGYVHGDPSNKTLYESYMRSIVAGLGTGMSGQEIIELIYYDCLSD